MGIIRDKRERGLVAMSEGELTLPSAWVPVRKEAVVKSKWE